VKVLDPIDMDTLMKDVAITMCMLKMIMPLVFFDVIIHIVIHLVDELDMCGPTHT